MGDDAADRWFLTPDERGNPDTDLDSAPNSGPDSAGQSWSAGNRVIPHVHGAAAYARMSAQIGEDPFP